ncbi:5652_t:CDS:2, partial [Acaulospora morrowiae]
SMSKGTDEKKSTSIKTWKNEKAIANGILEKKKKSLWSRTANYIIGRQIELPLKIISVIILSYLAIPESYNPLSRFLFLSYPIPSTDTNGESTVVYGKGFWDFALIAFWIIVFTLTR